MLTTSTCIDHLTAHNGCDSTVTTLLTVNPLLPMASISGAATGCSSVSLTASGGTSYLWSGGSSPGNAANTFITSGTYTVTVTDNNSCAVTASQVVTIHSSSSNLWSMTFFGGFNNSGVIFKYNPLANSYTTKIHLTDTNGDYPWGSLMQASDDKLYGMTRIGGANNQGVIFRYDRYTNTYTKLFDFINGMSGTGISPYGSLMQANDGNLYGMTGAGGANLEGVIFQYNITTNIYTKKIDFDSYLGAGPSGTLIQATDGKLYGLTTNGGNNNFGVIFQYDIPANSYTKKVDMTISTGTNPRGSLVQASDGKLYGLNTNGGDHNAGVIFQYDIFTNTFTKKIDLDTANGALPFGSLIQASDGKLYGMTKIGGANGGGVIFQYDFLTNTYTKKIDLIAINGITPLGSLMQSNDGKLYGMTNQGGSNGYGVIFQYDIFTNTYTKKFDLAFGYTAIGGSPQYSNLIEVADFNAPTMPTLTSSSTTNCGTQATTLSIVSGTLNDATRWQWYSGSCGGVSIDSGTAITVSPSITTTYYVRGEGGCAMPGNCASITITVNQPPLITVNSPTICTGQTATLTANGGTTYSWSAGATSTGVNTAEANPATTTSYTVTGITSGCSNTAISTVIVSSAVTVSQNLNICSGNSITVGSSTYASTGTYIDHLTAHNGCDSTVTTILTVNPLPTANASASSYNTCTGTSINFMASGNGVSVQWNFGNGNFSVSQNPSYSYSTPGNYNVILTEYSFASCIARDTILIVVNLAPNANFFYTGSPYCPNASNPSPSYLGGTAGVFTALPAGLSISSGTGTIDLSASTAGTYTVTNTIAASGGCGAVSASASITILQLQEATFNYSSSSYCSGGVNPTPIFTGAGVAGTFTASPSGLTIYSSTGEINLSTSAVGTYIVTNTIPFSGGCGAETATAIITINQLPVASLEYTGSPYCQTPPNPLPTWLGSLISGTFTSTAGLVITPSNGVVNLTASTPGTYTVTNTILASGGCPMAIDSTTITINAYPVINVNSPTVCEGQTASLTATGGATYSWSAGLTSTGVNTAEITPISTNTYTVTGTANGCSSTSVFSVFVNPIPTVGISPSPSTTTICAGANMSLNGTGATTYVWTGGIFDGTGFVPSGTTTYTVTGTSNGCSNTSAITITVNPMPVITNQTSFIICSGGTLDIHLTSSLNSTYNWLAADNGNVTGESYLSYQTTDLIANTLVNNTAVVQSVVYAVTPTAVSGGCVGNPQTINVTVNPPTQITITANGPTTFCAGGNVVLTAPLADSYLWSNSETTQSIVASNSGNYSVTTILNGCISVSNFITTTSIPHQYGLAVTASPQFGAASLNVAFNNNTPNRQLYNFLWTFGDGTTSTSSSSTVFKTYGFPGLYDVSLIATSIATGCTDTLILTGFIYVTGGTACTHTASVSPTGTVQSCIGNTVLLTANYDSAYTYQWNINSVAISGEHGDTLNVTQAGYYSVTVLMNGCPVTSSAVLVTFSPVPSTPVITTTGTIIPCAGGVETLTANGFTGASFLWNTLATSNSISVSSSGNYSVVVTNTATGCSSAPAFSSVNISSAPSIPICMVTVDSLSNHNIIYWENTHDPAIDSFRIYRETSTNVYSYIGSVSIDSVSEYNDYGADPNTTTYRYKISTLDTCGYESNQSNFHNTIYIIDVGNGHYTWNPGYTIENTSNPVNNYLLMRDDFSTGNWLQIASTAGTQNTIVDPNYSSYPTGSWRVETAWGISCSPTRTSINTSHSNIHHSAIGVGVNQLTMENGELAIYPNPATNQLTVNSGQLKMNEIKIYNLLGEVVKELKTDSGKLTIDISSLSKGVYTVEISLNTNKVFRKLVKE